MVVVKRSIVTVAVLLLLAGLPVASQPSTGEPIAEILGQPGKEITFYGHMHGQGRGSPMPMNTQFPDGEADWSRGQLTGCGVPGTPTCDAWATNEMYWYTTAGFVQVKQWEDFSYDKIHNERGQTKDIYYDAEQPLRSTFYMSADAHGWYCLGVNPCWNWDPGAFTDWVVESWVWHANLGPWSSDPSARPDMNIVNARGDDVVAIAHGKTEPIDMISIDPSIPVGYDTVYPFDIEYEWDPEFVASGAIVPYLNDLIVEFEWYQETPEMGKYITPGENWNINTGEDNPANIVMPVRNPLDVELVFPRFIHDRLVVLSVLNTPWGSYDVDLKSIGLEIRDSTGRTIVPEPDKFQEFIDVSVAHSGHYDPINITWIWDYKDQGLAAGDYELAVSATNFQGSHLAETVATFTITADGSGGEVKAGQSGLLSFTNDQFESYKDGAGVDGEGAGTDGNAAPAPESKGSPGFGALLALALLVGLGLRRRD